MKDPLKIIKISSIATKNYWSHIYVAGNLVSVLSLKKQNEDENLSILGKKLISNLEAEYFTLGNKNLQSLKIAILETVDKMPTDLEIAISLAVFMEDVVYLFIYGEGNIFLKREGKLGALLENKKLKTIESASGFIKDKDIIVIQTQEVKNLFSPEKWLDLNEASFELFFNNLSLEVEKEKDPFLCLVGINYNEEKTTVKKTEEKEAEEPLKILKTETEKEEIIPEMEKIKEGFFDEEKPVIRKKSFSFPHRKKILISVLFLILIVFLTSVYFFIQKKNNDRLKIIFDTNYPNALQKYNEGKGLLSLNASLARSDFSSALEILKKNKNNFSDNSFYGKKFLSLRDNIAKALSGASGENGINALKVDFSEDPNLQIVSQNNGLGFSWDNKFVYELTSNSVGEINKTTNSFKKLFTGNFKNPKSVGVFYGNIYVLDNNEIYKFQAGNFVKSNYALGSSYDFTNAVSLAIDGSIYVLNKDGTIYKFFKGYSQNFSISGLDKPFKNPSLILTSESDQNLYILDNGNSRIVVLDKKGNFQKSYTSSLLGKAIQIDVLEAMKTIYFTNGGALYKINL